MAHSAEELDFGKRFDPIPEALRFYSLDTSHATAIQAGKLPTLKAGQALVYYEPMADRSFVIRIDTQAQLNRLRASLSVKRETLTGQFCITDMESIVAPFKQQVKSVVHNIYPLLEGLTGALSTFGTIISYVVPSDVSWAEMLSDYPGVTWGGLLVAVMVGAAKAGVQYGYIKLGADHADDAHPAVEEDSVVRRASTRVINPTSVEPRLKRYNMIHAVGALSTLSDAADRQLILITASKFLQDKYFLPFVAFNVVGGLLVSAPAALKKYMTDVRSMLDRLHRYLELPSTVTHAHETSAWGSFVKSLYRFVFQVYPMEEALVHGGSFALAMNSILSLANLGTMARRGVALLLSAIVSPTLTWAQLRYQREFDNVVGYRNLLTAVGERAPLEHELSQDEITRLRQEMSDHMNAGPCVTKTSRAVMAVMTCGLSELIECINASPTARKFLTFGFGGGVKTMEAGQVVGYSFMVEEAIRKLINTALGQLFAIQDWGFLKGFGLVPAVLGAVAASPVVHAKKAATAGVATQGPETTTGVDAVRAAAPARKASTLEEPLLPRASRRGAANPADISIRQQASAAMVVYRGDHLPSNRAQSTRALSGWGDAAEGDGTILPWPV